MRPLLSVAALALLAACTPPALREEAGYDPSFGAGATPYGSLQPQSAMPPAQSNQAIPSSEINSALFGTPTAPGEPAAPMPMTAVVDPTAPVVAYTDPAATAPAVLPTVDPAAAPVVAAQTTTVDPNAAPAATGALGLSDEQDFSAVTARESIETDKQRIEANKAQYQQIAPTALPERTDTEVASVVDYAMNAQNKLGESVYKRGSVSAEKAKAACARYPTDAAAQEAFLKAGGPQRDSKKLDPDGDGFACGFDPTPFQSGG
jgi:hypothetical protein